MTAQPAMSRRFLKKPAPDRVEEADVVEGGSELAALTEIYRAENPVVE